MGLFAETKPRFIFAVCFALSVMGAFSFAGIPASGFREYWPLTDAAAIDADYALDRTEYAAKTRGYSSLLSRKPAHIIIPAAAFCAGIASSFTAISIFRSSGAPAIKNAILIKLRI
jgi:hypothetical protein